jgi:AcrR family transcriptional regulator
MTTPNPARPAQPAPEKPGRGGRPRDPDLTPRAVSAVIDILADFGLDGLTADLVVALMGCGKASLYRRWRSLDQLLTETVHTLGVRPEDIESPVVGGVSVHHDVVALVRAAVNGRRAAAERAVLSVLPHRTDLRVAYAAGPIASLDTALSIITMRAAERGDGDAWPGALRIRAAIAMLHTIRLTTAPRVEHDDVPAVLELLGILPAAPR